ncbi:DsbA family protein [Patescibacteria group bacterium]|nr:DsbA family protein [Patescibacteria group bacterium]
MSGEKRFIIGTIIVTVLVIVAAVMFSSSGNKSSNNTDLSGPKVNSNLLVRADSEKISSPSAQATLVEFGDFQCPACGAYHSLVQQVLDQFKGKLNFVFRNFPLTSIHQNAQIAAQTAVAAGLQGKFFDMYNLLYENQSEWSDLGNPRDTFDKYAQSLHLDINKFNSDIDSKKVQDLIQEDVNDANSLGVDATPTFYLNGVKLNNPSGFDEFSNLVKTAIKDIPITQSPAAEAYHVHVDFKVYLNDIPVDFSLAKYQSVEGKELDPYVHLHDGNGKIIHFHKKDVTFGEFFKSLKMQLSNDCFVMDSGKKYCNINGTTLKMYVNGKENNQFDKYVPNDLDRILITYGNDNQVVITKQIGSVTNDACIYSLKCPERGKPPTENCVGGLGTNCTE